MPNSVVYNDGVQNLLVWVATATPAMPDGASVGGSSDTSINSGPTGGSANTDSAELGPFGGAGTGDNTSEGLPDFPARRGVANALSQGEAMMNRLAGKNSLPTLKPPSSSMIALTHASLARAQSAVTRPPR